MRTFTGLAVEFVRECQAKVMIRGIRPLTDVAAEFTMLLANRQLADDVETIFLMADEELAHVSSSLIKQITPVTTDDMLARFVPREIISDIRAKIPGPVSPAAELEPWRSAALLRASSSVLLRVVALFPLAEMALQVVGALDVAVGRVEFHAAQFLEVGGLGVDEQLVDGGNLQIANQSQIDPHPHARQQVHGFFTADRLGRAEDAVGPADAIVQVLLAFPDQELARTTFVIDQHGHDVADLRDQLLFAACPA